MRIRLSFPDAETDTDGLYDNREIVWGQAPAERFPVDFWAGACSDGPFCFMPTGRNRHKKPFRTRWRAEGDFDFSCGLPPQQFKLQTIGRSLPSGREWLAAID